MPLENFRVFNDEKGNVDYNTTLKNWARILNYMLGERTLDSNNIASTTLTLGTNQIKDYMIDFGIVDSGQVNSEDVPRTSGGTIESGMLAIENFLLSLASSDIAYRSTSIAAPLSTAVTGSTVLTNPLATAAQINATNSMVNNLRLSLISLGILTT